MFSGKKWSKIKGKLLDFVMNMYKNGGKSKFFADLPRIRKGEYLALLLFALFVSNLEDNILQNGN